jgi:cyclin-dependent kinase regulatory subunit CKS1
LLHIRHVVLPKILVRWLPHRGLLTESECLALGISQSTGWQHYMIYGIVLFSISIFKYMLILYIAPEPHILLFKREKQYLKKVS